MTKRIFLAAAVFAAAVFSSLAGDPYKITVHVPTDAEADGAMMYLVNFDTGVNVDSVLIEGNQAVFTGEVDEPFAARLLIDGQRFARLFVENGSIIFNIENGIYGSPLNDKWNRIVEQLGELQQQYVAAQTAQERETIESAYDATIQKAIDDNVDNPISYMMALELMYDLEPAELDAFLEKYPSLREYKRIQKFIEMNARKASTSVGAMYIDYDINGEKLSDYVGKDGKYILVDYFASWCGPCKRQIVVLKELAEKYKDAPLQILGVAVWDAPDDTRRAIDTEGITWPCIINAGNIPTDLYGISGIPCIMLIGPDGTILARDVQDDDLREAVAKYLDK